MKNYVSLTIQITSSVADRYSIIVYKCSSVPQVFALCLNVFGAVTFQTWYYCLGNVLFINGNSNVILVRNINFNTSQLVYNYVILNSNPCHIYYLYISYFHVSVLFSYDKICYTSVLPRTKTTSGLCKLKMARKAWCICHSRLILSNQCPRRGPNKCVSAIMSARSTDSFLP